MSVRQVSEAAVTTFWEPLFSSSSYSCKIFHWSARLEVQGEPNEPFADELSCFCRYFHHINHQWARADALKVTNCLINTG